MPRFKSGQEIQIYHENGWRDANYISKGSFLKHLVAYGNREIEVHINQIDIKPEYECKEGEKVLAYYMGYWRRGTYSHRGNVPGYHFVKLDDFQGKDCRIINHELQFFLG